MLVKIQELVNKILQQSYSKQSSYNKFERKSDQINYEKKLSKDLTKEIIDQIILNLATKIK